MRIPLFLLALLFSVVTATAAQRSSSGGGGLSFDCSAGDAPIGKCYCTPPADSQDCKDMGQYCDGGISCGWLVSYCECKQKSYPLPFRAIVNGKWIKGTRPVVGGASPGTGTKSPIVPRGSLLDGTYGFGTQGPAATGTPAAPATAPGPVFQ
jgi:hypothetical protein